MASYVDRDGSARLEPADLLLVLNALNVAAQATHSRELAVAWLSLAYRLGAD